MRTLSYVMRIVAVHLRSIGFIACASGLFLLGICLLCAPVIGAAPSIPPVFDRKTVETMIAEIDKDHYASILRAIYFGTMSAKDYPIDQGYQELVGRMKTEEPGSIRWLLMASVRAYAAFRVPGDRQSEGYEEYDWIFTHSPELLRVHGVVIGERAMRDYAYTLTTQYGPRRQEGPKESKNVLLHAIAQQISFVRAGDETDGSIDWNGAIRQAGCAT